MISSSFLWVFGAVLLVDADVSRLRQRKGAVFSGSRDRKPNIVLILTDDQDVELGSLDFMPKTLRSIRDQGAQFRHAYVTTPMCCPSRSSLLTGMYVHNHHVYTNNDNCSSTQWQATYETRSFATYLSNAGYRTGYFGKYLNKYNGSYVPPGWREWGGLIMNSKYYNYSINMNGKKIKHGFDYYKDYYPDLIANDSIAFLRQSKKNNAHKPVMLTMSFPAPHGPEDSAPQYSHLFFNVTSHHTPSYDYAPNPDKQWILQVTQKMQPIHKKFTDLLMTKRLQTLQSVDAAVEMVVRELEALGELDNTYIIYTSDHGYHLGQFGLIKGKSFPFEFDVRIPFLVRGPGVEPGTVVDDIVLNIDLAPTFLDIAGVEAPPQMDGRSVLPLFSNSKRKRFRWPDTFLIESSGRRETPYLDAKHKTKLPPLTTDAPLSTMAFSDPFSTTDSSTTLRALPRIYESGEDLTVADDEDNDDDDLDVDLDDAEDEIDDEEEAYANEANVTNKTSELKSKGERLVTECSVEEMKLPCRMAQRWFCAKEGGRWRKHKCKTAIGGARTFRKCACFTPTGLVYKRIPSRNITRRHTTRLKRDALDHVNHVMKDVQGKLRHLKSANISSEDPTDLSTNAITEMTAGCVLVDRGRVNCSTSVYNDRRSWRQSRHQIDNEIHQLKQKLEKLKEIRRHLKYSKPFYEESEAKKPIKTENENELHHPIKQEMSTEHFQPNVTEPKRRRKRPLQVNRKLESVQPTLELTTSSPYFPHNHHRHGHRHYSTTERYQENYPTESVSTRRKSLPTTTTPPSTTTSEEDVKYDNCYCEPGFPELQDRIFEKDRFKEAKRRLKEDRLRRKLRKQRKKDQLESECASERMNCFHHDNDHWKTAPMWKEGPFCFCMNSNNNTYSCVRTINSTHNFLYCEFTTGLVTFYNLRIDPYELQNRLHLLKDEEKSYLHDQLRHLVACRGRSCTISHGHHQTVKTRTNVQLHTPSSHRYKKRKLVKFPGGEKLLPLTQSALLPRLENGHFYKTRNKTWRRRSPWKYSWRSHKHEKQKQYDYDGYLERKWY